MVTEHRKNGIYCGIIYHKFPLVPLHAKILGTAEQVSFEWSQHRVSSTDSKLELNYMLP